MASVPGGTRPLSTQRVIFHAHSVDDSRFSFYLADRSLRSTERLGDLLILRTCGLLRFRLLSTRCLLGLFPFFVVGQLAGLAGACTT